MYKFVRINRDAINHNKIITFFIKWMEIFELYCAFNEKKLCC